MATELTLYKCCKTVDTSNLPFYNYDALEMLVDVRRPYEMRHLFSDTTDYLTNVAIDFETIKESSYEAIHNYALENQIILIEEIGNEDFNTLLEVFKEPSKDSKLILAIV